MAMFDTNTLSRTRRFQHISQPGMAWRSFQSPNGPAEHFILIESEPVGSFEHQIESVKQRYAAVLDELGLTEDSTQFRRIFVSDILNQADLVRQSTLARIDPQVPVAISLVEQAPLSGSKLALLAHHIEPDGQGTRSALSTNQTLLERHGKTHVWNTQLCDENNEVPARPAALQTEAAFDRLSATLAHLDGNLLDHCVRTWIYMKDVDIDYKDMVESRIRLFNRQGLTCDTHYIASTGIEGACSHRADLIMMDAYSIVGLEPGQMDFLNDFNHLCSAGDYNVTFERGTRIGWRDRAHFYISGTASIDTAGQVVHRGDVLRQLDVALDNVDALLRSGGATLANMMYLIVYLRDPSDTSAIRTRLAEIAPNIPAILVHGPVCRPEWLVEVEGIAMMQQHRPELPVF